MTQYTLIATDTAAECRSARLDRGNQMIPGLLITKFRSGLYEARISVGHEELFESTLHESITHEHPCPKIIRASRARDQSILASCSNRESYLVFSIRKSSGAVMDVAMKCSAARALGVHEACS